MRSCVVISLLVTLSAVFGEASDSSDDSSSATPGEIQRWVEQLESGTPAERRAAAIALNKAHPPDPGVVRALIKALKDPVDYDLRTRAAARLGQIGPAAHEAIESLIDTLNDLDDTEDSLRRQSAFSLGQICEDMPGRLVQELSARQDPFVRRGIILALHYLGPKALSAVPLLIEALGDERDISEALYMEAVDALRKVGTAAVPALVEALRTSGKPRIRRGVARVLGEMYMRSSSDPAPDDVLSALAASLTADSEAGFEAAEALGRIRSDKPQVAAALGNLLLDERAPGLAKAKAAWALGRLPPSPHVFDTLITALAAEEGVRAAAVEAISQFGDAPVPRLVTAFSHQPAARVGVALALGAIGHDARSAAGTVVAAISDNDSAVQLAAIESIGNIGGPESVAAIGPLARSVRSGDSTMQVAAARAVAQLAPEAARSGDRRHAPLIRELATEVRHLNPEESDAEQWHQQVVAPLIEADRQMRREVARVRAIWLAGGFALFAAAVCAAVLSVSLQRRLRIFFGQRWSLVTGTTDYLVEIRRAGDQALLTVRTPGEALPTTVCDALPLDATWPPNDELVTRLRAVIGRGSSLRIETDEALFARDWTHVLGSAWSDGHDSIISGQVLLSSETAVRKIAASKTLVVAALSCPAGPGSPEPLTATEAEVAAVERRFRLWKGSEFLVSDTPSRAADVLAALQRADIVHLCAHASPDHIYASDRPITAVDFDDTFAARLRCRLLVLSACDAGRLNSDRSLVAQLVRMNVNVIAATSPVRDHVCQTFFEELYRALLPRRRAQDISIDTAVRSAVEACATRFSLLEETLLGRQAPVSWKRTVDAFILFGDPTMQLRLASPVRTGFK